MRTTGEVLVYLMTLLLATPFAAYSGPPLPADPEPAQERAPAPPAAASNTAQANGSTLVVKSLRIVPLEGEGAVNYIPTQSVTVPIVEVHNQNDLPVEGAKVVFQAPAVGPGGFFADKQVSLNTMTNSRGQAVARGFRSNSEPGRFSIRITASYQNISATYVLTQINSTKARETMASHKSHKWVWIGIAGAAAAAAGTTYALRRSDSTPHISASTGPVVISAP